VKKLILTIMGVVSILLSFNVNAKMSEGDYVDKICTGSIQLPSSSYLSPPNKRVAGLLGSYNNVVENSLGLTIYNLIGKL
jgi:hypothetical protein